MIKIVLLLFPAAVSMIMLGAHFYRAGNLGAAILCAAMPLLLFIRRPWITRIVQLFLATGIIIWITTIIAISQMRNIIGQPWVRMAVILSGVAVFTGIAALVFETDKLKRHFHRQDLPTIPGLAAFLTTALLLTIVHLKIPFPVLILERFVPGLGWVEILALSLYAAWITDKMLDRAQSSRWRRRIWAVFSIVFFAQLILGLAGFDKFLMTGRLHYPIPALIAAGPIFRGEGFFMLILFGATLLLVGPAWCSHLCYIGAWDDAFSRFRTKPSKMPRWRAAARLAILFIVIAAAILLRLLGVSSAMAGALAVGFGLVSVGIMIFWSRKAGVMTHCVTYCSIGLLANWLGKLSPFRIRINDATCSNCGICHTACRYDALNMEDIKKRRPALTCTLCGDCLGTCRDNSLEYRFAGLKGEAARVLFIAVVVSLHAVFLGVARI